MNERIFEIAKQADTLAREIEPDLREIVRYNHIRDEKFAELIVWECAEFARQHNLEKANRSHMIHKAIKQHFGVEE
jgi:G:T-mismatch repair DNA endonuclease (very short patch repair protein)